jgi:hypothetical protein
MIKVASIKCTYIYLKMCVLNKHISSSAPLLEDLAEALDDERHFLVVELGGVDGEPT